MYVWSGKQQQYDHPNSNMINIITPTNSNRRKRSIPEPQVEPHTIHGGERAFLYQVKQGFEDEFYDDHIKLPHWPCIIRFLMIGARIFAVLHLALFSVCGRLPVHVWYGRQGLSLESHLWDARIASPWLRTCRRASRGLPNVSSRLQD